MAGSLARIQSASIRVATGDTAAPNAAENIDTNSNPMCRPYYISTPYNANGECLLPKSKAFTSNDQPRMSIKSLPDGAIHSYLLTASPQVANAIVKQMNDAYEREAIQGMDI